MDEETSPAAKTAAPSWKPLNLKELDKTALEYSTVKRGDSQGKGRPRRERLFRGGVDGSNGRQEALHHYEPVRLLWNTRIQKLPVLLDSWHPTSI